MGHRDIDTTQRYADYAPGGREAELIEDAFGKNSEQLDRVHRDPLTDPR